MSDGCSGQCKSRHFVAGLMTSCSKFEVTYVGFHYYALREGKNIRDTTGSIVKNALKRGMFLNTLKSKFAVIMQLSI